MPANSFAPATFIVRQLMELGLLSVATAVEDGWSVIDRSVSHRSFVVIDGTTPKFFVKQADPLRSLGRDLRTEAAFYRLARMTPCLQGITPACQYVSNDDTLIVLKVVPGSSLDAWMLACGQHDADTCSIIFQQYGVAIANVHAVQPEPMGQPPWLLVSLEQSRGGYPWLPDPCRELLLRLAMSPTFRVGFTAARRSWRARTLVHGDLRWTNVLVGSSDGTRPQICLVDWELACLGDPAWDLGCVLADLLTSSPETGRALGLTDQALTLALAFFSGYRQAADLSPATWLDLLRRSVRLASVRLVQTLIEYGYAGSTELRARESLLLPKAAELLQTPPALVSALGGPPPKRVSS